MISFTMHVFIELRLWHIGNGIYAAFFLCKAATRKQE